MPGFITHLIAGSALYLIGRYSFRKFFNGRRKTNERLLLFICLVFSTIPDVFLGIYYATHLLPHDTAFAYHNTTHLIITPIIILMSLFLLIMDSKRRPIWLFGIIAILLHLLMDSLIQEHSIFF